MSTAPTRNFLDTAYPIIAHLTPPFDLVAHPNGPAITDGDSICVIDTHDSDSDAEITIKQQAQKAWREYSWPLLSGNFHPDPARYGCGGRNLAENWADDHTHLQNLCRKHGATEQEVEGDEYGIPAIQTLADWLDSKIESLTTKPGPCLANRTDYTTPTA